VGSELFNEDQLTEVGKSGDDREVYGVAVTQEVWCHGEGCG